MWPSVWVWLEAFSYMILNAFQAVFYVATAYTYTVTYWITKYTSNTWAWMRYGLEKAQKMLVATITALQSLYDQFLHPFFVATADGFAYINSNVLPVFRNTIHAVATGLPTVFTRILDSLDAVAFAAGNIPAALLNARSFISQGIAVVDDAIHAAEVRSHDAVETLRLHGRGMAKWINFTHHESGVFRMETAFWSLFPIRWTSIALWVETLTDQEGVAASDAFDSSYKPASPKDVAALFARGGLNTHPGMIAAKAIFENGSPGLAAGLK
jgi:hypothetical protein